MVYRGGVLLCIITHTKSMGFPNLGMGIRAYIRVEGPKCWGPPFREITIYAVKPRQFTGRRDLRPDYALRKLKNLLG